MEKEKISWKMLFELYLFSLKLGAFVIGGGYAMLPIIKRELVDHKKWLSEEEMVDYLAASQSLPGAISINVLTFVGSKKAGILGALSATLGIITAPFFVILLISYYYETFQSIAIIQKIFSGIRACVISLVFTAVIEMSRSVLKVAYHYVVAVFSAILIIIFKLSPIFVLMIAGLSSLLFGRKNDHVD